MTRILFVHDDLPAISTDDLGFTDLASPVIAFLPMRVLCRWIPRERREAIIVTIRIPPEETRDAEHEDE